MMLKDVTYGVEQDVRLHKPSYCLHVDMYPWRGSRGDHRIFWMLHLSISVQKTTKT